MARWLGNMVECGAYRLSSGHVLACASGGCGEWIVLADDGGETLRIVESITFGWCDEAKTLDYLKRIEAGAFDSANYGGVLRSQFIEHGYRHERGPCRHCA